MQLATTAGDQPWICTVYYVFDDDFNLYWLSYPSRRHSREVAGGSKIAVAIAVKLDQPVIGVQAEGEACIVSDHSVVEKMSKLYVEKYSTGRDFFANYQAGKNQHVMYCFKPSRYVLFDEVSFPGDAQQTLTM